MIVSFVDDGGIVDGIPGFYVLINGCTYINKRLKNLHSFHSKRPHIISKMNNKKEKKKQNQTNKHEQCRIPGLPGGPGGPEAPGNIMKTQVSIFKFQWSH
jgi:hypothetical protein